MKQTTTYFCLAFLLLFSSIHAQNKWAPNFELTDINGVEHNLYDYLKEGKPVILNFVATWCYDCWQIHTSNVLQEVYNQYGPDGSDELMILFIESDDDTGLPQLEGMEAPSIGNWIADTPFPIIDLPDFGVAAVYEVFPLPSIYVVCPDLRILENIFEEELTAEQIVEKAFNCDDQVPVENDIAINAYVKFQQDCAEGAVAVSLVNAGTNPVTQANLALFQNESPVQEIEWTGNLEFGEEEIIDFGTIDLQPEDNFFEIILEDNADVEVGNDSTLIYWEKAPAALNSLIIFLGTDENVAADNTQWRIESETGAIVAESGPLTDIGFTETPVTISSVGCYKFVITDDGGDGLGSVGFITVSDANDAVIFEATDFGKGDSTLFSIALNVSTEEPKFANEISIAPNPTNEWSQISFELIEAATVQVELYNVNGQQVLQQDFQQLSSGYQQISLNLNTIPSGIYMINLVAEGQVLSDRIIKQ